MTSEIPFTTDDPSLRRIAIGFLASFLLVLPACSGQKASTPAPSQPETLTVPSSLPPPLPLRSPPPVPSVTEPLPEGTGVTVWAKGYEGLFIAGLDGGLYDFYRSSTIEQVQKDLRNRGLYDGPMNGVLDKPTMQALFAFQKANYDLQRCGVPTPRTRKLLQQGSHTDAAPAKPTEND